MPTAAARAQASDAAAARLDKAFRVEIVTGLRHAMWVRCGAIGAIAILIVVQNLDAGAGAVLYYEAILFVFGLLSVAQYRIARARGGDLFYQGFFVVAEIMLLVFTVLHPNPFGAGDGQTAPTIQMYLRFENFLYFFVLGAGVVLTYSPRLVLLNGIATAVLWTVATWIVASLPDSRLLALGADLGGDWRLDYLHENAVLADAWLQQICVFLIYAGIMAALVQRARALVQTQVDTERERANLARYFSPNIVDDLAHADQPLGPVRRQDVAVLFADIVGFTRLAENAEPEAVIGLLRAFHGRMEAAVFTHGGTLDKYIGDAVMATFGTPEAKPGDPADALACARAMIESVATWNGERAAAGDEAIRVAIGVHYGPVVLGDIGGTHRLEFTVIGDTVNVASRLEQLARPLGTALVISEDLVAAVSRAAPAEASSLLAGFGAPTPQAIRGRDAPLAVRSLG